MKKFLLVFSILIILGQPVFASEKIDNDNDGISNHDEENIYFTDANNPDTDGDGYDDKAELIKGFSPHNFKPVKLEENDQDKDGLSDRMELNFHTSLIEADTDGDGFKDGEEINNGFDPLSKEKILLKKRIEINLKKQELSNFLGGVRMETFRVSSGMASMPTPKGSFKIDSKSPKAWSRSYGLWMPWFMGMRGGIFGIHELPVWPNGYREGENHLGTPVSHGCIRLGVGPAEKLFKWTPIGTEVFIY